MNHSHTKYNNLLKNNIRVKEKNIKTLLHSKCTDCKKTCLILNNNMNTMKPNM